MSFHGGLIGVILAMAWYAHKTGRNFFTVADFIAPLVPPALLAGRIGNFINGELWGRPTDLPWGMVFPHVDQLARHPSMLYEALLEGVVMFALLWWFSAKPRPRMAISGLFLLLYGLFRFLVEQVREPDAHLGFIAANWLSMGMRMLKASSTMDSTAICAKGLVLYSMALYQYSAIYCSRTYGYLVTPSIKKAAKPR